MGWRGTVYGFIGGGVGQQTVSAAGGTADIETVQLLITQRYLCINNLCNYKYVPMSEFFPIVLSFILFCPE